MAGEVVQCDLWFPPVDVPLGDGQFGWPPVLVMVSGYSRVMTAMMLPSRQSPDLLRGHWELLSGWGAVPRALLWGQRVRGRQVAAGKPELTTAMNGFAGAGNQGGVVPPRDPEAKGLVERANGYLETSFLPGRNPSPARRTSTTNSADGWPWPIRGCIAVWDAGRGPLNADVAAMVALPPTAPAVGWASTMRLGQITTSAWTPTTIRCTRR